MVRYIKTRIDQLSANEQAAIDSINKNFTDLESAIQDTVSRSGKTPTHMTKELDMNGRRIINIPEPVYDTDIVRKKDVVEDLAAIQQLTQQAINAGNAAIESAQTATSAAVNAADSESEAERQAERAEAAAESIQPEQFATAAQGAKADTALQPTDVINNTISTVTNKPLSANMGKEIQDQITNLKSRGRYLSVWNCTTGLAGTTPVSPLPYDYKTGDYFIVGVVGATNYKPNGSQYTGTASTTTETNEVNINDTYYYDGSSWSLLSGGGQVTATFSSLAGQPTDNANLASALNAKVDKSSLTEVDCVIESKYPTTSDPTWYRLYSDGWVEQGGFVQPTGASSYVVSLPKEMADLNYTCILTTSGNNDDTGGWVEQGGVLCGGSGSSHTFGKSTTTIRVSCVADVGINWEVKGMSAQ